MKFSGDNLIAVAVQKNAAVWSRKSALALVLRGLMEKTGEKLMIGVRCNLIRSVALGSMDFPGISM
jgi:hypothetical protein